MKKRGRKRQFNDAEVAEILDMYYNTDLWQSQIARLFRTTDTTIRNIIERRGAYSTRK